MSRPTREEIHDTAVQALRALNIVMAWLIGAALVFLWAIGN